MFILLDLDGVIVHFRFEQDVWAIKVPDRVAALRNMDILEAKRYCFQMYEQYRGTTQWSDINHWSRLLGFDITTLYDDVRLYNDALRLLDRIEAAGHTPVVVTASFPSINDLKLASIKDRISRVFSIFDYGLTKEDPEFFRKVLSELGAAPEDCIFVDDVIRNIQASRKAGVESVWLWRKEELNEIEMNDLRKFANEPHIGNLDELELPERKG